MMEIITGVLVAAVRSGAPILFAAQGEIISQKSGIMNLGLEGQMLMGAIAAFIGAQLSGSAWVGLLCAMAAGALLSLLHALLTVPMGMNQIISGLSIVFIGTGLSSVLGTDFVGQTAPGFHPIALGPLAKIPLIGPALFNQDAMVYIGILLTPLITLFLFKTRTGLSIRATGDSPRAADAAGLSVSGIRVGSVAFGGLMCGLGGAYMSLCYTPMWQPAMVGGRGWIGLALVIFSQWNPAKAMAGAYLFGGITALQLAIQISGASVSAYALQVLPYLFTILALVLSMWRAKRASGGSGTFTVGPASLAQPYTRE